MKWILSLLLLLTTVGTVYAQPGGGPGGGGAVTLANIDVDAHLWGEGLTGDPDWLQVWAVGELSDGDPTGCLYSNMYIAIRFRFWKAQLLGPRLYGTWKVVDGGDVGGTEAVTMNPDTEGITRGFFNFPLTDEADIDDFYQDGWEGVQVQMTVYGTEEEEPDTEDLLPVCSGWNDGILYRTGGDTMQDRAGAVGTGNWDMFLGATVGGE